MEKQLNADKNHWYHETQRSLHGELPVSSPAGTLHDGFLLGLNVAKDKQLQSALNPVDDIFVASSASYHKLFPEQVDLSEQVTLSLYDRLSTALTVAQATGVQRLCSHYAARLTPLSSNDASRQSNIRLAQITQYARQLASQPSLITAEALQQLLNVGLSASDIVVFSQIIGFISYQARVVAAISALAGYPPVVLPGFPTAEEAPAISLLSPPLQWQAHTSLALAAQLTSETDDHYPALLAYFDQATALQHEQLSREITLLQGAIPRTLTKLATLTVARVIGCRYSFSLAAQDLAASEVVEPLLAGIGDGKQLNTLSADQLAVVRLSHALTLSPERFAPLHLQPLRDAGWQIPALLALILTVAQQNWDLRLRYTLGSTAQ